MKDEPPHLESDSMGVYGSVLRATGKSIKLGSLLVVPWLYLACDRTDLANGKLSGFNWPRAVWLVPLFYLNAAIGSILFHMQGFDISSLAAPSVLANDAILFHLSLPTRLANGATAQFSGLDAILLSAVVVGSIVAGRRVDRRIQASRFRRLREGSDEGQYVLPLKETKESDGVDTSMLTMNKKQSILVLGQPGVGKTEAIRLLSKQLGTDDDEPFVVFDYKSEYQEMFDEADQIVLSLTDSTHYWNLFEEVDAERELKSVGQRLFPEEEAQEAGQNAFFVRGARQVFVATIRYMYRSDDFENPTNAHVAELFRDWTHRELHDKLKDEGFGGSVTSYLDPNAPEQAAGVHSFLIQTVEDVFVDDFAETGDFSVREYMENPQGRKLILDMPKTESDTVARAFRFFIDRAIQHALDDGSRGSYFILDEFARVPHLERIEDLTGAGRSQRAQGILGLQGVSQLKSNYEENYAQDILATVPQEILMRPGDAESTEYILDRIGKFQYTTRREKPKAFGEVSPFNKTQETVEEAYPLSQSELQRFDKGEAVLMVEDGWLRAKLPMWSELSAGVRAGLSGRPSTDGDRADTDPSSNADERAWPTRLTSWLPTDRLARPLSKNGQERPASENETESTSSGSSRDGSREAGGQSTVAVSFCPHCAEDLQQIDEPEFCPSCGNGIEV